MLRFLAVILILARAAPLRAADEAAVREHGVIAAFKQDGKTDTLILPTLNLFVAPGDAAAAFLDPGPFSVELRGTLAADLRGLYQFSAAATGTIEIQVNGSSVLIFTGNGTSELTKPVRLNRGSNEIVARYSASTNGPAQFQIFWLSKNWPNPLPVPREALDFPQNEPSLAARSQIRRGARLLTEYRCLKCHHPDGPVAPENDFDGPDFQAIGNRLREDWMTAWIADPAGERTSHMPRLFTAAEAPSKARAIAAYLKTLRGDSLKPGVAFQNRGEQLFQSLGCSNCHPADEALPAKARRKFRPEALASYLQNPQLHYARNPMPNFRLSAEEATAMARYLSPEEPGADRDSNSGDSETGQRLIQTSGCLNCHRASLENRYSAPALAAVAKAPRGGCVEGRPGVPQFKFSTEEKEALSAFLQNGDFKALARRVPHEFAQRAIAREHCANCHEKVEGLPRIEQAGARLKPEWMEQFLAGSGADRPRPWLPLRMPSFPAEARSLAQGLSALHGFPPKTPAETPADQQIAATGAKLVSAAGGFACVACHAIGSFSSGQVVESPGINLALAAERLQSTFFQRWVMNPTAIDPATKMPVYFDSHGRSQLIDILDGDGPRQISAIWAYLQLGRNVPPPPVP